MYLPSFSLNDCTTTRLQLASQHGGHDASEQSTLESLMVPQKMFLSSTIGLDPGERFKYHHTRHKRYITFDWCFSAALVGGYPNTMSQVARFVHNNQSQKKHIIFPYKPDDLSSLAGSSEQAFNVQVYFPFFRSLQLILIAHR